MYSRKSKALRTVKVNGIWTKTHSLPPPHKLIKIETPLQSRTAIKTGLPLPLVLSWRAIFFGDTGYKCFSYFPQLPVAEAMFWPNAAKK